MCIRDRNNAMGVSPNGGGPRYFDSVEDSIYYMAKRLGTGGAYKAARRANSLEALASSYSEVGAENDPKGTNKYWPIGVRKFYEKFSMGEA